MREPEAIPESQNEARGERWDVWWTAGFAVICSRMGESCRRGVLLLG